MSGLLIGTIGPPGTGKSRFIKSMGDWAKASGKRVAVACMGPGEEDSYPKDDAFIVKNFMDEGWLPLDGKYEAKAFRDLYTWLGRLGRMDDVVGVGLDTLTEASYLAMHDYLKDYDSDDPKDGGLYGAAYMAHDRRIMYLRDRLWMLARGGKHVICACHGEMRETEGQGTPVEKATMASQKVDGQLEKLLTWPDMYIPTMLSKVRQQVPRWFSYWLASYSVGYGNGATYWLSAAPKEGVPAKGRRADELNFQTPHTREKFPNDFATLIAARK